jgi:hypothetical protein
MANTKVTRLHLCGSSPCSTDGLFEPAWNTYSTAGSCCKKTHVCGIPARAGRFAWADQMLRSVDDGAAVGTASSDMIGGTVKGFGRAFGLRNSSLGKTCSRNTTLRLYTIVLSCHLRGLNRLFVCCTAYVHASDGAWFKFVRILDVNPRFAPKSLEMFGVSFAV